MNIGTKKGLGIITCKRQDYYLEIVDTTPFDAVDKVYVFDSSPNIEKYARSSDKIDVLHHDGSATVGFAKNRLMEAMIEDGMDHIFLQEGDVKLLQPEVFEAYIETAKHTGIWGGLNYAWHGNGNHDSSGTPIIKNSVDYTDEVGLDFTHNGTAAFSYMLSQLIKKTNLYHDEYYNNCWEHLDFYQALASMKMGSYWWWFTDIKDSSRFIEDLDDGAHGGSVIRKDDKWKADMKKGVEHFQKKYKYPPTQMPHATEQQVLERLEWLQEKYSRV